MANNKTTIAPLRSGTPWTKQDVKDLKSLIKGGNSCREIADSLDRTIPSIWTRMSSLGLKVKRSRKRK